MKVYSQLEVASIENLATDPSLLPEGRVWLNTTEKNIKSVVDGVVRIIARADKIIVGSSGTLSSNVLLHRSGTAKIQFTPANDATADGTAATAYAELDTKIIGYANIAALPAAAVVGRVAFVQDVGKLFFDTGAAWKPVGSEVGTSSSAANNVRLHRSGTAEMQLVPANDTTADGTKSTSLAAVDAKIMNVASFASLPAAGNAGRQAFVTDELKLYVDNGTTWEVSSGSGSGQGAKNYAPNSGNFNSGISGWSAFNTTFSGGLPGAITSGSTKVSLSHTTTNPLSERGSLLFSVDDFTASAGHGFISDAMTIDDSALGKMLSFAMDYRTMTGSSGLDMSGTSTQTLEVWVYNVGLAAWTQPSGFRGMQSKDIPDTVRGELQADISDASNKNQYRIALIIRNAPTSTGTTQFDNIFFGQSSKVFGAPITDWQAFTPILTGAGTTANPVGFWRRVGGELEAIGSIDTGTVTGTQSLSIPANLNLKASVLGVTSNTTASEGSIVGRYGQAAPDANGSIVTAPGTSLSVVYLGGNQGASANHTIPAPGGSLDHNKKVSFWFKVPIEGWSTSVVMSSDADTRLFSEIYSGNGGTSITANVTDIDFSTKIFSTHAAWSGSSLTAKTTGLYRFTGTINITASIGYVLSLYVNGVKKITVGYPQAATSTLVFACEYPLNAGDVASIRSDTSFTLFNSAFSHWIAITKASGPSAIAASEFVGCRYGNSAGTSLSTGVQTVPFNVKSIDTHNAFVTNTFTAPVKMQVIVKTQLAFGSATYNSGDVYRLYIQKNDVTVAYCRHVIESTQTRTLDLVVSDLIDLNAGDTIKIKVENDTAKSLDADATRSWLYIAKVSK